MAPTAVHRRCTLLSVPHMSLTHKVGAERTKGSSASVSQGRSMHQQTSPCTSGGTGHSGSAACGPKPGRTGWSAGASTASLRATKRHCHCKRARWHMTCATPQAGRMAEVHVPHPTHGMGVSCTAAHGAAPYTRFPHTPCPSRPCVVPAVQPKCQQCSPGTPVQTLSFSTQIDDRLHGT